MVQVRSACGSLEDVRPHDGLVKIVYLWVTSEESGAGVDNG